MKKIPNIRTISFDGDQTLWDFEKVMRHSLSCVMKELEKINPHIASLLTVEEMIKIRERVAAELKGKIINLTEVRLAAFRRTLREIGRPDDKLAHHLNGIYFKHRFENAYLFDDTIPTLSKLKKRHNLGLLSNGNTYPENAGLEGIFDFVVFSQEFGIEKPDPRIFEIAVEKAGCRKEEFLHVGDSLEDDVAGAANAGVRCAWLNRSNAQRDPNIRVELEISSLRELPEIL